jgi:hypothetical protein
VLLFYGLSSTLNPILLVALLCTRNGTPLSSNVWGKIETNAKLSGALSIPVLLGVTLTLSNGHQQALPTFY